MTPTTYQDVKVSLESSRQVLLKKMPACAFPFLKLCRKRARILWQRNIAQHVFFEIGNGYRFVENGYIQIYTWLQGLRGLVTLTNIYYLTHLLLYKLLTKSVATRVQHSKGATCSKRIIFPAGLHGAFHMQP
jgi:hypothetical protein